MRVGNVVLFCGRKGIIVDIRGSVCKVLFRNREIKKVHVNFLRKVKSVDDSDVSTIFAKQLVGKKVTITFPDKNNGKKGVIVKVTGWTEGYGATCLVYVPEDEKVYEYPYAHLKPVEVELVQLDELF